MLRIFKTRFTLPNTSVTFFLVHSGLTNISPLQQVQPQVGVTLSQQVHVQKHECLSETLHLDFRLQERTHQTAHLAFRCGVDYVAGISGLEVALGTRNQAVLVEHGADVLPSMSLSLAFITLAVGRG